MLLLTEVGESLIDEIADVGVRGRIGCWAEFAEEFEDLVFFEVEAFDFVIEHATVDGGVGDETLCRRSGCTCIPVRRLREGGSELCSSG